MPFQRNSYKDANFKRKFIASLKPAKATNQLNKTMDLLKKYSVLSMKSQPQKQVQLVEILFSYTLTLKALSLLTWEVIKG